MANIKYPDHIKKAKELANQHYPHEYGLENDLIVEDNDRAHPAYKAMKSTYAREYKKLQKEHQQPYWKQT